MSVTVSSQINGKDHQKYLGMTPRIHSDASGVTLVCEFPGGVRIPIPVTPPGFRPDRSGGVVAFYRPTEDGGLVVTYFMPCRRRGERHFQFGVEE